MQSLLQGQSKNPLCHGKAIFYDSFSFRKSFWPIQFAPKRSALLNKPSLPILRYSATMWKICRFNLHLRHLTNNFKMIHDAYSLNQYSAVGERLFYTFGRGVNHFEKVFDFFIYLEGCFDGIFGIFEVFLGFLGFLKIFEVFRIFGNF